MRGLEILPDPSGQRRISPRLLRHIHGRDHTASPAGSRAPTHGDDQYPGGEHPAGADRGAGIVRRPARQINGAVKAPPYQAAYSSSAATTTYASGPAQARPPSRTAAHSRPMPVSPATLRSTPAAELRLLPLLTTHMSFPEIAEELSRSHHTVTSQAYSADRKTGVSSRSQAVSRSRELMLLEGNGSHGL